MSCQFANSCAAAAATGTPSPTARPESRRIQPLLASCTRISRFVFIATASNTCQQIYSVITCRF